MAFQPKLPETFSRFEQVGFLHGAARSNRRMLRDDGERQRLTESDSIGRLSKIDQAGSANALDVPAERRKIQIRFQQLALRVSRLEPESGGGLPQLARRVFGIQPVKHPRQLHRQG